MQDALGRRVLIENPSRYLDYVEADMPEPEFLNALARRSGCGILLDINNAYVSAKNLEFDAGRYIDAIDPAHVEEIHLAGHAVDRLDSIEIRVDNHGGRVCDDVLALHARFVERAGPRPTLIEWDTDVPDFESLVEEARRVAHAHTGNAAGGRLHDAA
jgi:uncharacterized protein (UPF0276 family)